MYSSCFTGAGKIYNSQKNYNWDKKKPILRNYPIKMTEFIIIIIINVTG